MKMKKVYQRNTDIISEKIHLTGLLIQNDCPTKCFLQVLIESITFINEVMKDLVLSVAVKVS